VVQFDAAHSYWMSLGLEAEACPLVGELSLPVLPKFCEAR